MTVCSGYSFPCSSVDTRALWDVSTVSFCNVHRIIIRIFSDLLRHIFSPVDLKSTAPQWIFRPKSTHSLVLEDMAWVSECFSLSTVYWLYTLSLWMIWCDVLRLAMCPHHSFTRPTIESRECDTLLSSCLICIFIQLENTACRKLHPCDPFANQWPACYRVTTMDNTFWQDSLYLTLCLSTRRVDDRPKLFTFCDKFF